MIKKKLLINNKKKHESKDYEVELTHYRYNYYFSTILFIHPQFLKKKLTRLDKINLEEKF